MQRHCATFYSLSLLVFVSAAFVSTVFAEESARIYDGGEQTTPSDVDNAWTGELVGRQAENVQNPLEDGNVENDAFHPVVRKYRPASVTKASQADDKTPNDDMTQFYYYLILIAFVGVVGFTLLAIAAVQWMFKRGIKKSPLFPTAEISRQPFPAVSSFDEAQDAEDQSAAPTDEQMQNYPRKSAA